MTDEPMATWQTSLLDAIASGSKDIEVTKSGVLNETLRLGDGQNLNFVEGISITFALPGKRNALEIGNDLAINNGSFIGGYGDAGVGIDADGPHGLALYGNLHVTIVGCIFTNFVGDGIYVGSSKDGQRSPCVDVDILDTQCGANGRNGITIVAAEGLQIEDCLTAHTKGSPPQAGIDIEPNASTDVLKNIRIENHRSEYNAGAAYIVNCSRLTQASQPVSIDFKNLSARFGPSRRFLEVIGFGVEDPTPCPGYVALDNTVIWGSKPE